MKRSTGRLRRGDAEIYYEVMGDGPPIVFAHGLGGNHMSWWQQLAHFARSHTCVAFAHRGFPPSSAVPGSRAPDAYADDLAALITALDLKDPVLVAQSMGGWTCLEYALREPKRVRALVMGSGLARRRRARPVPLSPGGRPRWQPARRNRRRPGATLP
jgi:pimeloyl-ACP methyl ester carboxylesterase